MIENPVLSIIVPVYNVERFLRKCIDSILNQTFTDFECILIDDGSSDSSGMICDEYGKKDERIIVIHQKNSGVSAARNAGLDIAKGKYIGFVDSDDWIEKNMYDIMINKCKSCKYDCVICGYRLCSEEGYFIKNNYTDEFLLEYQLKEKEIFSINNKISGGNSWNKIFIRYLINDIRYDKNLTSFEDEIYILKCFERCCNIFKIKECLYNYRNNSNSCMRKNTVDHQYNIILNRFYVENFLSKNYEYLSNCLIQYVLDGCLYYARNLKKCGQENNQPYRYIILRIKTKIILYFWRALIHRTIRPRTFLGLLYGWIKL